LPTPYFLTPFSPMATSGGFFLNIMDFSGTAVFAATGVLASTRKRMDIADAIGLALVTGLGCVKAHFLGLPATAVVLMGVITGCAGGIIRDVLSAEVPHIFRKGELYAAASLPGAIALVTCWYFGLGEVPSAAICMGIVLAIRLAALRWRIHLPSYSEKD